MKNRVITISREFGSGGRTIGREAAEKLGVPCYDEELINKIAEKAVSPKNILQTGASMPPLPTGLKICLGPATITVTLSVMICGKYSGRSFWSWQKKAPVLSWAGARTTF